MNEKTIAEKLNEYKKVQELASKSLSISKKLARQIVAISAEQGVTYSEFGKALELARNLGASQSVLRC